MADGTQPSGSGTEISPYQVATLDNLLWISTNDGSWGDDFIQMADIDASNTSSWNGGAGFSPLGNDGTSFTGNYNGDGHYIAGLFINRPSTDCIGFFGYPNGANIQDLGVTNVNITGGCNVGGLVGYNYSSSTVSNSYSTGTVSGDFYIGGLVGRNYSSSTVSNSYSTGSVSGDGYIGGLVGDGILVKQTSVTATAPEV